MKEFENAKNKPMVLRERIYRMIQKDIVDKKLLYWRANTGWGKTTTMLQYFDFMALSYFYISVDEDTFLEQVQNALRKGIQHIVIDDLNKIDFEQWEDLLLSIQESSNETKFYFLSRAWIPAQLKKYEITNEILCYDTKELAFTLSEAEELLKIHNIPCEQRLLMQIVERTKGWLVYIIFMSTRGQNRLILDEKLIDMARVDLFDYFDQNVYPMWKNEEKSFLLHMGHLSTFTEKEACVVCSKARVIDVIKSIMSKSSFLIQMDENTFHIQLPMDVYLNKKQKEIFSPEIIKQRYENTGLYFAMENDIPNALKYYSLAGDQQKITELLIENTNSYMGDAYYLELEKYYREMDEETLAESPEMLSAMAFLHSMFMRIDESNRYVKRLEDLEKELLPKDPRKKVAKKHLAHLTLGLPHYGSQSVIKKLIALSQNKEVLRNISVSGDMPSILSGGLDFCEWSLKDRQLYKSMRSTINFVLGKECFGITEIALGESLFEKNSDCNYTECLMLINSGKTSSEIAENFQLQFVANALISRIYLSEGRIATARNIMNSFYQKVEKTNKRQLPLNIQTFIVWIGLLNGENQDYWLTEKAPDENNHFYILERYRYLMKVRVYIQMEMYLEAISLLERVEQYFLRYERRYNLTETRLLRSIVFYRMKNKNWMQELEKALDQAWNYRLVRVISDHGVAVLPLLEKYTAQYKKENLKGRETDYDSYLNELLQNARKQASWYPKYLETENKQYHLSEAEKRILVLLVQGMTNQEIAQKLSISISTVKTHTGNIYEKLNVKNRTSAVQLAMEQNLCEGYAGE